jgi:hypothetical protein
MRRSSPWFLRNRAGKDCQIWLYATVREIEEGKGAEIAGLLVEGELTTLSSQTAIPNNF